MINAETKKARKAKNMGDNAQPPVKPRVSAPKRDLGLFSRAEKLSLIWTSLKKVLVVGR